jgi:hypothetical protein
MSGTVAPLRGSVAGADALRRQCRAQWARRSHGRPSRRVGAAVAIEPAARQAAERDESASLGERGSVSAMMPRRAQDGRTIARASRSGTLGKAAVLGDHMIAGRSSRRFLSPSRRLLVGAGQESQPGQNNSEHGHQKQRRDRASHGTPPHAERLHGTTEGAARQCDLMGRAAHFPSGIETDNGTGAVREACSATPDRSEIRRWPFFGGRLLIRRLNTAEQGGRRPF